MLFLNAYNAFTLKLILNNYGKIKSITELDKPWDKEKWNVAGDMLSLNEIEHERLRKDFSEPRIHFAIVCASIGCPDLWEHAYSEDEIYSELNKATKKFVKSPKHVLIKSTDDGHVLYINQIFNWFGEDFKTDKYVSVLGFIEKHANKDTKEFIEQHGSELTVKYLEYDWNLNEK